MVVSNRLPKVRRGHHLTSPEADPEIKNSGKCQMLPRQKSTVIFSMICSIFFPAQLFHVHFLSFKFVQIKSLDFILQFISIHRFYPFLLLPHFTFFFPLIILVLNCVFSLGTTCFHSSLLLFLPRPASQNQLSCLWASHIFFLTLKIPAFSLHLLQSFLAGCGQVSCCCIFKILSLDLD